MLRRNFIGLLPILGASTLAPVAFLKTDKKADRLSSSHHGSVTVTYKIAGFTCITCAIGLETLLSREKGVISVNASYADATAVIEFDPDVVTELWLRESIQSSGFSADSVATYARSS